MLNHKYFISFIRFSTIDPAEKELILDNISLLKASKMSSFIGSKHTPSLETLAETDSEIAIFNNNAELNKKVDKYVTATSSIIDNFNDENSPEVKTNPNIINESKETIRDSSAIKIERYPRQHRIKIRSSKKIQNYINPNNIVLTEIKSIGVNTENIELKEPIKFLEELIDTNSLLLVEDKAIPSKRSSEEMCRICHGGSSLNSELGDMISACACRGTVGKVHVKCLEHWLTESGKSRCELCGTKYVTQRIHRHGVAKSLVMWLLSQNAKQVVLLRFFYYKIHSYLIYFDNVLYCYSYWWIVLVYY